MIVFTPEIFDGHFGVHEVYLKNCIQLQVQMKFHDRIIPFVIKIKHGFIDPLNLHFTILFSAGASIGLFVFVFMKSPQNY